ncbi:MAG: hypothetical protein KUG81_02775, partial [Gammaproteobacteria bacterium]|nr:hypothetical protein [Gammaproteobacteria bacterium]
ISQFTHNTITRNKLGRTLTEAEQDGLSQGNTQYNSKLCTIIVGDTDEEKQFTVTIFRGHRLAKLCRDWGIQVQLKKTIALRPDYVDLIRTEHHKPDEYDEFDIIEEYLTGVEV